MNFTQCAACAAPLGLALGKKCGRCSTRYCGPACQEQEWKEGGHDKLCKKIKKAGGAEQYYADKRYKQAVAVAVKKYAEDTKGQTCYICTEVFHRRTKEGLVRGCACHTTEGFVHVSCLAEQAKILCDEAEENNLDVKVLNERFARWHTCSLCEQEYHGVVAGALGWVCWKTYECRPERDLARCAAITVLGNGLSGARHFADASSVQVVELSMKRRLGASEANLLLVQSNLAGTYRALGRLEQAHLMQLDVFSGTLKLHGEDHRSTIGEANNYADSLFRLKRFEEAKTLLRQLIPAARRVLGESCDLTLRMGWAYAQSLYKGDRTTLDDLSEAWTTLEKTERTARRVFGRAHPLTEDIEFALQESRAAFSARCAAVRNICN